MVAENLAPIRIRSPYHLARRRSLIQMISSADFEVNLGGRKLVDRKQCHKSHYMYFIYSCIYCQVYVEISGSGEGMRLTTQRHVGNA
jgi:hypothetical protein